MSDLKKYVSKRQQADKEFALGYEDGYRTFKIGALLKLAREESGLTQEEVARLMRTKKSAISRIENHAEDIKLSTLERLASVLGKELKVSIG